MANSNIFPAMIRPVYDGRNGLPAFLADVDATASKAQSKLNAAFGGIGDALARHRTSSGSLDLNANQYRQAADAAELHAVALREVAEAARRVALADPSPALRRQAKEAASAAVSAQDHSRATAQQAISMELLQAELNKSVSATKKLVSSQGGFVTSVGASRQASVGMGQQLQDMVISIGSGQRASTVFAQQLPQLAFALSNVGGKVGSVAQFFAGPWGVALALGSFALGPLIDGLFKTEKGSDDAARSSRSFGEVLTDQTSTTAELTKAVSDYNREQERANKTVTAGLAIQDEAIKKTLGRAKVLRLEIQALLENTNAQATLAQVSSGGSPLAAIGAYLYNSGPQGGLTAGLAENKKLIEELEIAAKETRGQVASEFAKIHTDEKHAIEERYKIRFKEAENTIKDQKKLNAEFLKLEKQKIAELAALKPDREAALGLPKVTGSEVAHLLNTTINKGGGLRSVTENKNAGGAANSYHLSGAAIDIPLTVNGKPLTKEGIRAALEPAGVQIKELLGPGDKGHNDHFHIAFNKNRAGPDEVLKRSAAAAEKQAREIEKAQRETERLASISNSASEAIARINEQFDDQPRLVDQSAASVRRLQEILETLDKPKNAQTPGIAAIRKDAMEAIAAAEDAVNKPFRDILQSSREQVEVDQLIIDGRELEAEILSRSLALQNQKGPLTVKEAEGIAQIVIQERLRSVEMERQRALQQRQLGILEDTQANLRQTVGEILNGKGFSAIGGLFKRQLDIYIDGLTSDISESLFGDAFKEQKLKLLGLDKVDEAGREIAKSIHSTASQLDRLRNAARGAADGLGAPPANDNGQPGATGQSEAPITVTGARSTAKIMRDALKGVFGTQFSEEVATRMANAFTGALEGAAMGSFIGSAFGGNGSKIGRGVGAVLGGVDKLLGKDSPLTGIMAALPEIGAAVQLNQGLGKLLGNDQLKDGMLLTLLVGPFIAKLIGSSLRGSAIVGDVNGSLGVTGTRGNSAKRKQAATDSANSVIEQIEAIAEQLGGGLNSLVGSASIGIRKKQYVLDPSGAGRTKGAGVIKFGKGEEAAIAAARALALDLINDGVITGLRAGSQKLLANAKSLEAGLSKALKFQSVFDRLKAIKDPMGAAIDGINKEFVGLISIFKQAGASAEEFAQLEELYGLERATAIKDATANLTSSLRSLIDDLKMGENGLSLRDRLSNVRGQFDPLANTIRSGGTVDYDKFSELARQLIDIQRQISGSQKDYFATFNEVLGLSESALAGQQNVVSIGSNSSSPFSAGAAPSNASTPVVGAISNMNDNLGSILNAINANISNLGGNMNYAVPSSGGLQLYGNTYF